MRYVMETEAHVYALAVAASVLLSFYPFITVMLSVCRNVLHSAAAAKAIFIAIDDYFPGGMADFIRRNQPNTGELSWTSMFLLLFTANGVFEPMEVALNKVFGARSNRSYLQNQLVALGMIFMCGGLALASLSFSALNQEWLRTWGSVPAWVTQTLFKAAALPLSILALFLIYWLLPNCRIKARRVLPVAIWVGLALEGLKYLNLLVWPMLRTKLTHEYGVFANSVTILIWSFLAALIILAGAEWAARPERDEICSNEPETADGSYTKD